LKGKDLDDQVDSALDRLLVEFGKEILKIIPGKVSTEVDARFSFDTGASVEKALHIIEVELFPVPPTDSLLTLSSCTRRLALGRSAFSSRLPQPGKASRPLKSCSQSTASTVT